MPKLPAAVQQQIDAADELATKLKLKNSAPPEPAASPQVVSLASTPDPSKPESAPQDPAQPEETSTPARVVTSDPPDPAEPDPWQQRYQALQGKYNAEVPRLHEELREIRERMANMQASMLQPPPAAAPEPVAPQSNLSDVLSPEEQDQYEEDFLSMVDRIAAHRAQEQLRQQFGQYDTRFKETEQRLDAMTQFVAQNQSQPVYAALDGAVSSWRDVNKSPEFNQWLDRTPVSELSAQTMREALQTAFGQHSADQVVGIFKEFIRQSGQKPSEQSSQPAPVPATAPPAVTPNPGLQGSVSLETLSGPGTPLVDETPANPSPGRVWTDASIRQFYDDVRAGKIKQADYVKLEQDLQHAISPEGLRAGRYRHS